MGLPVCGIYSHEEALWDSVCRGLGSPQRSLESTDQVKSSWTTEGEGEGEEEGEGMEQVSKWVEPGCKVEPGRSPTNSSSSDKGKLVEVERGRGRRMRNIFEAMLPVWLHSVAHIGSLEFCRRVRLKVAGATLPVQLAKVGKACLGPEARTL